MVTKESAIKTVESFAKDIVDSGINLKKVILFGSFAKNTQNENSDIDVVLVADEFIGIGFKDIKLFIDVLIEYIRIQPKTFPTDYFDNGDPFIEEIKKDGIEIRINEL
jgi:predicted nucleotidyltransferase